MRVRITGCGVVSPLGNDLAAFDDALFAGRSAVRSHLLTLPGIDPVRIPIARAAFDDAAVRAPSRLPLDRGTAMALAAAADAAHAARLEPGSFDAERAGVFWGSGMAGAATFDATCQSVYGEARRMRPTTVITAMPNAPVAELALRLGVRGSALGYACACASSAVAIGEAMRAIRAGWLDVAIVGGSEALLTPGVMASWQAMRVLAPLGTVESRRADAASAGVSGTAGTSALDGGGADGAAQACRPFAADRNGFALGEAAAAFVLESDSHADARGATAVATLAGYATNCDAVHITNPDASGQARAMQAALDDAGVSAADIGYLNAHGTATAAGDAVEAESIRRTFGSLQPPVSSTKAIHGHLLGACGAIELLAALRAIQHRSLPPNANVERVDPAFAIDLITGSARPAPNLRAAMSTSFAFGGTNAVLIALRA